MRMLHRPKAKKLGEDNGIGLDGVWEKFQTFSLIWHLLKRTGVPTATSGSSHPGSRPGQNIDHFDNSIFVKKIVSLHKFFDTFSIINIGAIEPSQPTYAQKSDHYFARCTRQSYSFDTLNSMQKSTYRRIFCWCRLSEESSMR